jgi:hypothetical protein
MSGIHRGIPVRNGRTCVDSCNHRGRLRKSRLTEQHGADYGVARLRETLIADCPRVASWHEPCRAYYVG